MRNHISMSSLEQNRNWSRMHLALDMAVLHTHAAMANTHTAAHLRRAHAAAKHEDRRVDDSAVANGHAGKVVRGDVGADRAAVADRVERRGGDRVDQGGCSARGRQAVAHVEKVVWC